MHNKKSKPSSISSRLRNPDSKNESADVLSMQDKMWQKSSKTSLVEATSRDIKNEPYRTILKRGLDRKAVLTELFLIECENNFEDLSMKGKLAKIARSGDVFLREYLVQIGINENIPQNMDDLKQLVVDYCIGKDIQSVKRYMEESWGNYISRLKDIALKNGMTNRDVIEKLRAEWMPEKFQILIHNSEPNLDEVIERITQWEKIKPFSNQKNDRYSKLIKDCDLKKSTNVIKNNIERKKMEVTCFNCNKKGHYKNTCPDLKGNINFVTNETTKNGKIDIRKISLSNRSFEAIFDTGASDSFISKNLAVKIDARISKLKEPKSFVQVDGTNIIVESIVETDVTYKGFSFAVTFYILENRRDMILLGYDTVEFFNKMEAEYKSKSLPIECTIDTGEYPPVSWTRPIRRQQDKVDFSFLVKKLEENDIIEKSVSTWLNPIVLTRKRNGDLRFCLDLRRLNDCVKLDEFEIPKIDELMTKIRGMQFFTTIDLKDGFFQIPIKISDRHKTTFCTGERLLQFKKMPQGFKNSPAIFQRCISIILEGLVGEKCLVYIDDILIFGKDSREHDENVRSVLYRLNAHGIVENYEKRIFRKKEVEFLGYKISSDTIKPLGRRSQAIQDYSTPKNRKELQRFLGLINYDRKFIKNITEILEPLYRLLDTDKKYIWTNSEQNAFDKIRNLFSKCLELRTPDFNLPFTIECDASNIGIGAVLYQEAKPIAFVSRALRRSERNYGITDREFLACLWGIEKLQYYLAGRRFTLMTDHKAIEEIKSKREFGSARTQRWLERLNKFEFDIIYTPGKEVINADAISRATIKSKQHLEVANKPLGCYNIGIMGNEKEDQILKIHQENCHRKKIHKICKDRGLKVSEKMVIDTCRKCPVCIRYDAIPGKSASCIKTTAPGDLIGIDTMEIARNQRIVVGIDYFSRKAWAKLIKSKEALKIIPFLEKINKELPFRNILADNGREFNNKIFKEWCSKRKIAVSFSIPYHHASNGRVERLNRTIREALKRTKGNIKSRLEKIIENYNGMTHRALGMSPSEALLTDNRELVLKAQEKYAKEFLRYNRNFEVFKPGDKVLIRNENKKNKMDYNFKTVGIIKNCLFKNVYEIKLEDGKLIRRHSKQIRRDLSSGML